MDPSKDPVIVVDENDDQLEIAPRAEAEADTSKIIRMVYILLYNEEDQILLQERQGTLERFPGHWEVSASGAVREGEGYVQAADRKLMDELGMHVPLFHEHKSVIKVPGKAGRMTAVFIGKVTDLNEVKPNQVKVKGTRWVGIDLALKGFLLTPSCEEVLKWWGEHGEEIKKNVEEQLVSHAAS